MDQVKPIIDCATFRTRLASSAEQWWTGGTIDLSEQMRAHATVCPACAARLAALESVVAGSEVVPVVPEGLAARVSHRVSMVRAGRERRAFRSVGPSGRNAPSGMPRGLQLAAAVALIAVTAFVTTIVNRTAAGADAGEGGAPVVTAEPPAEAIETVEVHLYLDAPQAQSVAVAGDWNDWDASAHRLADPDGDGVWEVTFSVERGREYEYQFLIDDSRWTSDPAAAISVDDGFGGENSILDI